MKVVTKPEVRCEHCNGFKEREEHKYVSDYSGADLEENLEYVFVLGFKKKAEHPVPLFYDTDSYHFLSFEEEWLWIAEHWEEIKRMEPPGVEGPQDYVAVDIGFTNHMPWPRFISLVEAAWDSKPSDWQAK